MKKIRIPKLSKVSAEMKSKDVVRSSPKTTHVKKPRNYGKNLGGYLYKSKLPTGAKIGADVVKTTKRKSNKMKGY